MSEDERRVILYGSVFCSVCGSTLTTEEDQYGHITVKPCECKIKDESFSAIINPVIRWINKYRHPHTRIIVDGGSAELLEGIEVVNSKDVFIPCTYDCDKCGESYIDERYCDKGVVEK